MSKDIYSNIANLSYPLIHCEVNWRFNSLQRKKNDYDYLQKVEVKPIQFNTA